MELLTLNSAQHRIPKGWSFELDSSPDKPLAIGRDSRFHSEDWGGSGEVRLSDVGLSEEQQDRGVQSCGLQPRIPFMLGHCFGPKPAPCGSALFCFRFAALWVTVSTFGGPTVNAELGTWEPGPLARLRRG
jgi:hypothetical protein